MPPSPMNGVLPPFTLPAEIVYFHDWRYVSHGYLRWLDDAGQSLPLMPAPQPLPPVHGDASGLPNGVHIETIPASVDSDPAISAADLNEILFFGGNVIDEGNGFRMFYESCLPDALDPSRGRNLGHHKHLRVAESSDGYTWRLPKIRDDEQLANVVFDPGAVGYHGGTVMRDTHGPAAARYKSLFLGMLSADELAAYRRSRPDAVDPMAVLAAEDAAVRGVAAYAVCGAVSADGSSWQLLPEPMLVQHSDTLHGLTYDQSRGKYVAYLRSWLYGRRTVARSEADDFATLPPPEQILWPDAGMRPDETWYTPGYATMPDAPDYHLMFATRWSQHDDTFTPILHSSPDGIVWNRVPGAPAVAHGPAGSWYACGSVVRNLLKLPGDRIGSMIMGWHVPHKFPRLMPGFGATGWATWRRGRVACLRAAETGWFDLQPLRLRGRRMILNYRSSRAGSIEVAVIGATQSRSFADCDIISGDELDRVVSWRGETDLGYRDGEAVQCRFRLHNAQLFSVRFA